MTTNNGNNELIEIDATEIPASARAANLPDSGLMQTKTAYSTAVMVIKKRELIRDVLPKCLEEAAIAGDDFYYSYSQGGNIVEGLTVGAALAIARNMGNNAVDVDVKESGDAWYFTAAYIDLETGFNLRRAFRQNKSSPVSKTGKAIYSGDRGKDIIFQIGQSKAIRNVTLNAVPNWLARKVFDRAKENVIEKIKTMGVPKASQLLLQKIEQLKIPIERVTLTYGKAEAWDTEKIVMLTGAVRSIEDGRERIEDVFPDVTTADDKIAQAAKDALAKVNGAKK